MTVRPTPSHAVTCGLSVLCACQSSLITCITISQLGIGSIGTLFSHHLRRTLPDIPITLLVKSAKIFRHGYALPELAVERDGKTESSRGFDLEMWNRIAPTGDSPATQQFRSTEPIDSLLVCLKTPATVDAVGLLQHRLRPSSVVTLLQNGMGTYDELCQRIWPDPKTRPFFVIGTTTHGVGPKVGTPGTVVHRTAAGHGDVKWGVVPDPRGEVDFETWLWGRPVSELPILSPPVTPNPPLPPRPHSTTDLTSLEATITALMTMLHLSPILLPMPHLHHNLLLKLALNSIINPLTAVLGGGVLPNGALLRSTPIRRAIRLLILETSDVLTAYLHSLSAPHAPPPDVIRLFSCDGLEQRVISLAQSTRANQSSMAADVSAGRPSEIDYINGYIVALGRRLGVETPNHNMIIQMVKFTSEINGLNAAALPFIPRTDRGREVLQDRMTRLSKRQIDHEEWKYQVKEREISVREEERHSEKSRRKRAERKAKEYFAGEMEVRARWLKDHDRFDRLALKRKAALEERAERQEPGFPNTKDLFDVKPEGASPVLMASNGDRLGDQTKASFVAQAASSGSVTSNMFSSSSAPPLPHSASRLRYLPHQRGNVAFYCTATLPSEVSSPAIAARPTPPATVSGLAAAVSQLINSPLQQQPTWEFSGDKPLLNDPPSPTVSEAQMTSVRSTDASPKQLPDLSKGGMGSAIDRLIASAPRQEREWDVQTEHWRGLMRKSTRQVARTASNSVTPVATVAFASVTMDRRSPTLSIPTASAAPSPQAHPWAGELDRLITSAPRQARTWDVSGGVSTDPTDIGESPKLALAVGKLQPRDKSSQGGLGGVLDNMIAAAPRQERTYDWQKPVTPGGKKRMSRFSLSKSSGS